MQSSRSQRALGHRLSRRIPCEIRAGPRGGALREVARARKHREAHPCIRESSRELFLLRPMIHRWWESAGGCGRHRPKRSLAPGTLCCAYVTRADEARRGRPRRLHRIKALGSEIASVDAFLTMRRCPLCKIGGKAGAGLIAGGRCSHSL